MLSAAQVPIEVPAHIEVTEEALAFWPAIIEARAREEWIGVDLIIAGQLAQCQSDMDREGRTLRDEGSVIENNRGTPVMNPRHSVIETLARREMALMRALRMGGKVVEDPRSKAGARKIEQESKRLRAELVEDDLLAQ